MSKRTKRDYIGEVLEGPTGIESFMNLIPEESKMSVESLLTWLVRSSLTWQDLRNWRSDVRAEAFVLADKDGVEFM